jgi:hypothetical protein
VRVHQPPLSPPCLTQHPRCGIHADELRIRQSACKLERGYAWAAAQVSNTGLREIEIDDLASELSAALAPRCLGSEPGVDIRANVENPPI